MTYFSLDDPEEAVTREEDLNEKDDLEFSSNIYKETLNDKFKTFNDASALKKMAYWLCGIETFLKG